MSEEYLRQLRELERQEQDLKSQYTNEEKLDPNDYKQIVNARLNYAPKTGQTWQSYADTLGIYTKLASEKNRLTHIDGPRKAWWTHRNPMGCFCCEDTNLISCLYSVIQLMASQYPENKY